jgi:hypothetical protein
MAAWALWTVLAAALALAAWVRLAPSDPATWHVSPSLHGWDQGAPWDRVVPLTGGAALRFRPPAARPPTCWRGWTPSRWPPRAWFPHLDKPACFQITPSASSFSNAQAG